MGLNTKFHPADMPRYANRSIMGSLEIVGLIPVGDKRAAVRDETKV